MSARANPESPPLPAAYFVLDAVPAQGPFALEGAEGRHALVRRMRLGEQVVLSDGQGSWAAATVQAAGRSGVALEVGATVRSTAPRLRVVLVQAIGKGDGVDVAIDLATQAGVDEIVPWWAEHCVARWDGERQDRAVRRWRTLAREAAKQSRRTWVPPVRDPTGTDQVCTLIRQAASTVVLHEGAGRPLAEVALPDAGDLVLVVGPEGGISPAELAGFAAEGAEPARLGPQVLRSAVAAAVALGALGVLTDRWRQP